MAWIVKTEYKDRDEGTYWDPKLVRVAGEAERFEAASLALKQSIKERWIAAGRDMSSSDYPWYGAGGRPQLDHGWRFPPIDPPLRDQLMFDESEIVDIINTFFGFYAISQKVIDIIESIEPGVHNYIPYELIRPDGTVHPARRWLLNICTRVEGIDVEKSNMAWGSDGKFGDITADGRQRHIVVKAAEASKRALWYEWRYRGGHFIVSDRLWNALQAEGIHGWGIHHSYPDHIEEV